MNLLIDTHALIWFITDNDKLVLVPAFSSVDADALRKPTASYSTNYS